MTMRFEWTHPTNRDLYISCVMWSLYIFSFFLYFFILLFFFIIFFVFKQKSRKQSD